MGKWEDYYRPKAAAEEAAAEQHRAAVYNRQLATLREVLGLIMAQLQVRPPDRCDWVELNGQQCVAWMLYSDSDYRNNSIYLLPDGRLIAQDPRYRDQRHHSDHRNGDHTVLLPHDVQPGEERPDWQDLFNASQGVLSVARQFGIPEQSHWQADLAGHMTRPSQ